MSDDFNRKTEDFLHRWLPLAGEEKSTIRSQEETTEKTQERLELFMKKVESQAQEELLKRKASPVRSRLRWELAFARLRHPAAVTALVMSICAAVFLVVAKGGRQALRQSFEVSFPANATLKESDRAIELLRAGSLELGEKTDPSRIERMNAAIRQEYNDRIEPNQEQLPPSVRGRLTEMILVYNDSLAEWKKTRSVEASPSVGQISPVNSDDSARVAEIYRVVKEDNPANAEVLKNASIVSIDANKVVWSTAVPAQSWNDASFRHAADTTSTTLSIRDQQGSYQREFAPTKSAPNR